MERNNAYYETPMGLIKISAEGDCVNRMTRVEFPDTDHCPSPATDRAAAQLAEYFAGKRRVFDIPIAPQGTPFQVAVWQALLEIPYGETRSYGQIATAVGNPKASRAVGMACNRNPIWIVIPCHRVVGSNKNLTGYAGGLDMKQALLDLEQA